MLILRIHYQKNNNVNTRSAILITHGTNTLAWTHAAARYAVKHNKVNIAIPEIQIRLAYLMGHRRQIESYCQTHGKTFMEVVEWLFMSPLVPSVLSKSICFSKSM